MTNDMKIINTNRKYLEYLFLLGPLLTIMGLVAGIVSDTWSLVPLALMITGIVVIGCWLFMGSSTRRFWERRSTQVSTNALIATLAVLAILGLINFLGVRYAVRADLTENKLFTLSRESQQVVRSLQQPVKVWVFDRNQNPANRELLENYRRYGSQFNYEFVDPQFKPGLAQKFEVKSPGEVYLESGTKRQLVQTVQEGEQLSEVKLTNGIQQITSDRKDKIYFLQGHGEHPLDAVQGGLSQALSNLKDKSYSTSPLNLAERADVPQDAAVVVVAGPKRALFPGEVKALRDYLANGGNLLVMVDPNVNSGLDPLLKDWGVQLDNRLAIDASENGRSIGLGAATPLVTRYGEHPITKDFGSDISFYPLARPVVITPVKGVEQTPLLLTDEKSWAESNPEGQQLQFNPGSDRKGPLILGVALKGKVAPTTEAKAPGTNPNQTPQPTPTNSPANTANSDKETAESRLVVLGNSNFASDGLFEQQLNGDVFLNSISWLSKRDDQILSIRPKEAKNRRINLNPVLANIIGWSAIGVIPLIGFTTAGILWWRRR
jgi:ABC-type uncharacterized transport system involved in gliding motility auxiliary subunit